MVSNKFSRRPRIQPLPPVCRKSPETTSCYKPPIEPPEPLTAAGTLEILSAGGDRLYYSTFRSSYPRHQDYEWNLRTKDSEGNTCEPELVWDRPISQAAFDVTFAIPIWGGHTFSWPIDPLTDAFPWLFTFSQTILSGETHICNAQFWN